jgi:hypothetical protein
MSRAILSVLLCLLAGVFAPARAEDTYRQQMKGLDEQVQEVKSDVLSIAAELNQLQERLLYPSDTHLAAGEHDIQISLNGKLANGKDYTYSEHFAFTKAVKPKLMGVTLAGPDSGQPAVSIGDW